MLKNLPEDFKRFFFLEFTKQLIENSTNKSIYELEHLIKDKTEEEKKEFIEKLKITQRKLKQYKLEKEAREKELVKEEKERVVSEKEIEKKIQKYPKLKSKLLKKPRRLKVPSPKLPEHLSYLKPEFKGRTSLDLGRLNLFLDDPMVKEIQCDGPNENILVSGIFGTKPTKTILKKEEIDNVIDEFSNESKIPVEPGLFKVVIGNTIFTAIISETTNSRFIITKMNYNPGFRY
jgi:hypothetical protein